MKISEKIIFVAKNTDLAKILILSLIMEKNYNI